VVWPTSVSARRRPWRSNSFTPSVDSSVLIWFEIVGCERRSSSLARAMLPVRATVQK